MFEATSKTITKTSIYLQQEYIHKVLIMWLLFQNDGTIVTKYFEEKN